MLHQAQSAILARSQSSFNKDSFKRAKEARSFKLRASTSRTKNFHLHPLLSTTPAYSSSSLFLLWLQLYELLVGTRTPRFPIFSCTLALSAQGSILVSCQSPLSIHPHLQNPRKSKDAPAPHSTWSAPLVKLWPSFRRDPWSPPRIRILLHIFCSIASSFLSRMYPFVHYWWVCTSDPSPSLLQKQAPQSQACRR